MLIAQISDTHFGTQVPEVMYALEASLAALQPQVIVLSGDITQRARRSEFQAAAEFVERLPPCRKIIIPGNHDIPLYNLFQRLWAPYRHYRQFLGARETIYQEEGVTILGLDATSKWQHTRGKLCPRAVQKHIDTATGSRFVIACAHQPLAVALAQDQENILINADAVAQIFSEKNVDLVLSGHVHFPLVTTTQQAYPNLPKPFVLCGAGTAISRRTRRCAPNSYNVIRIDTQSGQAMSIQLMEYNQVMRHFHGTQHHHFSKDATGWHKIP